jgi:polyferredoxin
MRFLYGLAFVAFCVFWLISTPIYFLTELMNWLDRRCRQLDVRLSRLLGELYKGVW